MYPQICAQMKSMAEPLYKSTLNDAHPTELRAIPDSPSMQALHHRLRLPLFLIIAAICMAHGSATAQLTDTARLARVGPLQDTLYVLDSLFIEIDIDTQQLLLHRSGGAIDTFLAGLPRRLGPLTVAGRTLRSVAMLAKLKMAGAI